MSFDTLFNNRTMVRHLRRGLGVEDAQALQTLIDRLKQAGSCDPDMACLADRLPRFLSGVVESYASLDRDLQLRTRSLDLSSEELSEANHRLRQESQAQQQVLDTLHEATSELMTSLGQAHEPQAAQDLLGLARLMRELLAQRERAQTEALTMRSRLVSAIEALDVGFAMYDRDEVLIICNATYHRMYHQVSELMVPGVRLDELLRAYHQRVLDTNGSAAETEVFVSEQRALRIEKRRRETRVENRWIRDDDTQTEDGMIVSLRTDITEMKELNLRMAQARDTAEAANRAKSEFLANMSHEIRTPMNGIIGMTALALDTALDAEQTEYLQMVRSSADSLLVIVNDILDFSKMEAGMMTIEALPVHLPDLLNECLKPLGVRAFEQGLELMCRVSPAVPSRIQLDPGRLRQVLTNLVGNAIKFTERGHISVEVRVEASTTSTSSTSSINGDVLKLEFVVRDTGIGIERAKQANIFDAFSQADASITRRYGGTGLGLAIVQRLVALMGGELWLHSEAGKGSEFHFTVSTTPDANADSADVVHPLPRWLSQLKGLSVLIVDDSVTHCHWLSESIKHWGLRPTVATSGEEAKALMEDPRRKFAVCLIDADMPNVNGFELARQLNDRCGILRQSWLMISPHQLAVDVARCAESGFAGHLTKPILQPQLLDVLMKALGSSGPASASEMEPSETGVTTEAAKPVSPSLDVLLVEDMPVNQRLATRMLEKMGHRVSVAKNGAEAVNVTANHQYDVVLMDMQMPVMDGLAATSTIRHRERGQPGSRRVPIIAMTANAMAGDRDRCLGAGMDGYVSKPIDRQGLVQEIQRVLHEQANQTRDRAKNQAPVKQADINLDEALERLDGDRAALLEIALMFIDDCPARVAEISEAVASRDGKAVSKACHNLAGTAGNMSAHGVCDLVGKISARAQAGEWGLVDPLLDQLPLTIQRVENLLERWASGG